MTIQYIISGVYKGAILNQDYSLLSDEETIKIKEWVHLHGKLKWAARGYSKCEISGVLGMCDIYYDNDTRKVYYIKTCAKGNYTIGIHDGELRRSDGSKVYHYEWYTAKQEYLKRCKQLDAEGFKREQI